MTPDELGAHIDTTVVRRIIHGLHSVFLLLVLSVIISTISSTNAHAVPLGTRSLSLLTAAAGAITSHNLSLTLNSALSVGSISVEYCQESPLFDTTCTSPAGLSLSSALLASQAGETGFSIHASSTASKIILSRVASVVVPGVSTYSFSNVVNPSGPNTSAYVRVATYGSSDGSGLRLDEGGLAFAISNPLNLVADIPQYLVLCTGITVSVDCTSIEGSSINLGEFSPNLTKAATSQFAIASNDDSGYNTFIIGTTLISGLHDIQPSDTQSTSIPGVGQFGINLVPNTSPSVGDSPSGAGTGAVSNNYDDSNLFKFLSGDLIASSSVSTDFNRFTLSYIVNVPNDQPPGLYSTTLTILGVADF